MPTQRIAVAHLVIKNEMSRYLQVCLESLGPLADVIHVVDDGSRDGSGYIATDAGALVDHRPFGVAALLEDESACRAWAWAAMERRVQPCEGDWICCVDADEFLVANAGEDRDVVEVLAENLGRAEDDGVEILTLPVAEVFDRSGEVLSVRHDGLWGSITATRLMRYREGGVFSSRLLGCGSLPQYGGRESSVVGASLLHMGYADEHDRWTKYHRYSERPGHNPAHVDSIRTGPTLSPWLGGYPAALVRPR